MTNRIAVASLIVAIITMFITLGQWQYPTETKETKTVEKPVVTLKPNIQETSRVDKSYDTKELIVAGLNIDVYIKKGSREYQGGEVKGMNQESTIYVPKGQIINVKANGSNIKLMVDKELIDGISVTKSGLNIDVIEL